MSTADFTRWNRPGLPHVRYVDANAPTHLEALRAEFGERFSAWTELPASAEPDETEEERLDRLILQYQKPRQDWAWETSRSFARALHILTEHVDAYANESFLRTATQWEHVRRLAAIVGYSPKPATSAETRLALIARERGVVEAGFQVKHIPPAGGPPIAFETLEDIAVDPLLNEIRLEGWRENPLLFGDGSDVYWEVPKGASIAAGDPGILVGVAAGMSQAVTVDSIDAKTRRFKLKGAGDFKGPLALVAATLLLKPAKSQTPTLNGPGTIWLKDDHDLSAKDVVAWNMTAEKTLFTKVAAASHNAIRLATSSAGQLPAINSSIYKARTQGTVQFVANEKTWRLPMSTKSPPFGNLVFAVPPSNGNAALGTALTTENSDGHGTPEDKTSGYIELKNSASLSTSELWFFDPVLDAFATETVSAPPPGTYFLDSKPKDLKAGDFALMTGTGFQSASTVLSLAQGTGPFQIGLNASAAGVEVLSILFDFKLALRPVGHDRDPRIVANLVLDVGQSAAALLKPGRKLVLEDEKGSVPPIPAAAAAVDPAAGVITLATDSAALAKFSRGGLIIRGNTVTAGHGESKPLKALGSGNAEQGGQEFSVDFTDVSTVRDTSLSGGIRADVAVTIDRQAYHQLASFRDSTPEEPAYIIRVLDNGSLTLRFGNGRQGRRLPTGLNNVMTRIRRGSGLGGNLPPFSLNKITAPHLAVLSIRQPLDASGGDAREELAQVASNAPARLAAMDRAISVKDYERLAANFGGIWHAAAFELENLGRFRQAVRVILVPAGGGALGSLGGHVQSYLTANGLPQTDVTVEGFVKAPVELAITLRINTAQFDPEDTIAKTAQAVMAALDLRRRRPGQPLYRSEIIEAIEHTTGVVNSDVRLFPAGASALKHVNTGDDGGIWAAVPHENQVIYAADPQLIAIIAEEARF